jgi:hypothetical protein
MKNLPIWRCLHRRLNEDGTVQPISRPEAKAPAELPSPIIVPCMHRGPMPMLGPSVGPYFPMIDTTSPR